MEGWIKVHRKIRDCWLWNNEEPFDKRSAWIDLLMSCNHEGKKVVLGKEIIFVERGSFITSVRKLCLSWKWSNTKVTGFLELLQKDKMIRFSSDTKKTVISIENYGLYQFDDEKKRHENDEQTTNKHTNKNDNNDKNEKKENNISDSFSKIINSYTQEPELQKALNEFIQYRKDSKKSFKSDKQLNTFLEKLTSISKDSSEKIQILNNTIAGGWQGIFPLKKDTTTTKSYQKASIPQASNFKQREYDDEYYENLYENGGGQS